jgi:hypothetical protein
MLKALGLTCVFSGGHGKGKGNKAMENGNPDRQWHRGFGTFGFWTVFIPTSFFRALIISAGSYN